MINGGPGSAIWKTTDGGVTWKKLEKGLPKEDLGRIALAIAPSKPDTVYALVEAANKAGGFFRSTNQGGSWEKRSSYVATAPLFPVRDAWMYIPSSPYGGRDKASFGDRFFTAPNPPFGAVFTYYLKDEIKSQRKARLAAEKAKRKKGEDTPYPTWETLRAEDREEEPAIGLTAEEPNPFARAPAGPLAAPGRYTVSLAKRVSGVVTPLGSPQSSDARALGTASLPPADR